jgi:hypothetical protein
LGKNSFGRFKYIIVVADDVMVYAGVKQCGYVLDPVKGGLKK